MPSPTSNDHQVRIRIDGADWLGADYLGIDPPQFFTQSSLTSNGTLIVGRCECGCEGCDDVTVLVIHGENEVSWTNSEGLHLHFNRKDYDKVIASAREDFSWEDTKRTAERLVASLYKEAVLDGGYKFDWASSRAQEGVITLSFSRNGTQKLLEFPWDGRSPEQALEGARQFYDIVFKRDI